MNILIIEIVPFIIVISSMYYNMLNFSSSILKVVIKLNEYNHKVEPSLILSTWSLNLNGGMPLVKGSTIINLVLICSMTIFLSFTLSLMAKYLRSMCLLQLPLFLFLAIKTAADLSSFTGSGVIQISVAYVKHSAP